MAQIQDLIRQFVVIEFIQRGKKPRTKCVDIVPESWIIREGMGNNQLQCFFPPPPYEGLQGQIENFMQHQDTWPRFRVKCLGITGKFNNNKKYSNIDSINWSNAMYFFFISKKLMNVPSKCSKNFKKKDICELKIYMRKLEDPNKLHKKEDKPNLGSFYNGISSLTCNSPTTFQ